MIDHVDQMLKDWFQMLAHDLPVSLEVPKGPIDRPTISLYLLELASAPPPRGNRRVPLQILLRYLVTTWAPDPAEAHRLLGELVFAALGQTQMEMEVDLNPLPTSTWNSLSLPPRPSFVLRVPLRHERPEKEAPPVRFPLITRAAPAMTLMGRVLGPGDVPLSGAFVELPLMDLVTQTDPRGRFLFSNVPTEPRAKQLRVRAKGMTHSFLAEPDIETNGITVRLPLKEE